MNKAEKILYPFLLLLVGLVTLTIWVASRDHEDEKFRKVDGADTGATLDFCEEMWARGKECIVADSSFSQYWDQESIPCTIGWTDSEGMVRCTESWSPLEIPWLEK